MHLKTIGFMSICSLNLKRAAAGASIVLGAGGIVWGAKIVAATALPSGMVLLAAGVALVAIGAVGLIYLCHNPYPGRELLTWRCNFATSWRMRDWNYMCYVDSRTAENKKHPIYDDNTSTFQLSSLHAYPEHFFFRIPIFMRDSSGVGGPSMKDSCTNIRVGRVREFPPCLICIKASNDQILEVYILVKEECRIRIGTQETSMLTRSGDFTFYHLPRDPTKPDEDKSILMIEFVGSEERISRTLFFDTEHPEKGFLYSRPVPFRTVRQPVQQSLVTVPNELISIVGSYYEM